MFHHVCQAFNLGGRKHLSRILIETIPSQKNPTKLYVLEFFIYLHEMFWLLKNSQKRMQDPANMWDWELWLNLAKWLSVHLRTKWLWVRITLLSLKLQILRVLTKEFLDIQATIEFKFTLKRVRDMIITYSQFATIVNGF